MLLLSTRARGLEDRDLTKKWLPGRAAPSAPEFGVEILEVCFPVKMASKITPEVLW